LKEATITIYNSLGNKVLENVLLSGNGNSRYTLNLEGLPDGIYFIKIETGDIEITRKIIIRK
jgi:hypothetical protein